MVDYVCLHDARVKEVKRQFALEHQTMNDSQVTGGGADGSDAGAEESKSSADRENERQKNEKLLEDKISSILLNPVMQ